LAAPQVGLSLQLAVIEDKPEYLKGAAPEALAEREREPVPFFALFNPRIAGYTEETIEFFEGCLSVTGFSALVRRARGVTVEYLDERAEMKRIEARGWFARILQHEIDHLEGRLYIDRMEPRSFTNMENLTRYWREMPAERLRQELRIK
jgi:peptide deformylase